MNQQEETGGAGSGRYPANNRHLRWLQVLVWLAAVAGLGFLLYDRGERVRGVGLVDGVITITAPEAGQVSGQAISAGDQIAAGAVLASYSPHGWEDQVQACGAAIAALEQRLALDPEIAAAQVQSDQAEGVLDQARLEYEAGRLLSDLHAIRFEEARADSESQQITAEIRWREGLQQQGLVSAEDLYALHQRLAQLRGGDQQRRQQIEDLRQTVDDLIATRRSIKNAGSPDRQEQARQASRLEIEVALAEWRLRLAELEQQRQASLIRSPVAGQVIDVTVESVSRSVERGEMVARIAAPARRVTAWIQPNSVHKVAVGQAVQIMSLADPDVETTGTVSIVGAAVVEVDQRVTAMHHSLVRGRPVVVDLDGESRLLAGEPVRIQLD